MIVSLMKCLNCAMKNTDFTLGSVLTPKDTFCLPPKILLELASSGEQLSYGGSLLPRQARRLRLRAGARARRRRGQRLQGRRRAAGLAAGPSGGYVMPAWELSKKR